MDRRLKVDKKLFFPSLAILLTVIIAVATNLEFLQTSMGAIYTGCISAFGWLFLFADICCLLFSLWMMFGRYKDVRLGGEIVRPLSARLPGQV